MVTSSFLKDFQRFMLEDVTVKYELFLQKETASPIPGRAK